MMDPGSRGGRANALYIAAAAALGVGFWWRYARKSGVPLGISFCRCAHVAKLEPRYG